MELQDRKLSTNMTGDDVALLHVELQKLGFRIPITELQERRFGRTTSEAIRAFQKRYSLPVTGKVDEHTAKAFENSPVIPPLKLSNLKPVLLKLSENSLSSGVRSKKVQVLHKSLRQFGHTIDEAERKTALFGTTTHAAVTRFQEAYHLSPTGTVDKKTLVLLNAASTIRVEGNSVAMRNELRTAVDEMPDAPVLPYWLARYELLAGNYVAAHEASVLASDFPLTNEEFSPIFDIDPQRHPEGAHPENFYTYRHALVDTVEIRAMKIRSKEMFEGASDEIRNQLGLVDLILDCLLFWNQGNQDIVRRKFQSAEENYSRFYESIIGYFVTAYEKVPSQLRKNTTELSNKLLLLRLFFSSQQGIFHDHIDPPLPDPNIIINFFSQRSQTISLKELFQQDWVDPTDSMTAIPGTAENDFSVYGSVDSLLGALTHYPSVVQGKIEAPLLALAWIFIPMALAETMQGQGQYNSALKQLDLMLDNHNLINADGERLLSEFIEIPYLRILRGNILMQKADSEFKARIPSDSQDTMNTDAVLQVKAAETYREVLDILEKEGEYVTRVRAGAQVLNNQITTILDKPFHPLAAINSGNTIVETKEIHTLGKVMPIDTIESTSEMLPGLDRRLGQHETLIKFVPPDNQSVLKETNPLIYAMVAETQAQLMQIEAGFNYLGYLDDYIPPWRFQFLLDRARYFTEHAKNAQREYLNFLSNAEREEFQEASLAQSVELERSNVRIETARVEQTMLQVEVSKLSKELAELVAENSNTRLVNFSDFDSFADAVQGRGELSAIGSGLRSLFGSVVGEGFGGALAGVATGVGDFFSGGAFSREGSLAVADRQRDYEKRNLMLSIVEANKSAAVAGSQLDVTKAALTVAAMQRTAALLRHQYAVENLSFSRGRVLNAETWMRLADLIGSVSATYMRFAVELAFLAEQAYEFEAEKRINVIRFDYDVSEVSGLLAADFLQRDLDTLEQDLIVHQKEKQQQVRYILSLGREFPEALQELHNNGSVIFSLRLEQIERRFPGLFNIRIGSVEMMPVALMDSSRFSMEFTHLGTSLIRLKAQPDTPPEVNSSSPLNINDIEGNVDSWLGEFSDEWPVKVRVTGPETAIFSGLTKQESSAVFPFISNSQRNAFNGLGSAASWRVDMSMKENHVVPGTLEDLLITFTLSGYYDVNLRTAIDSARRRAAVLTKIFSAQKSFADDFYEFKHTGRMSWNITEGLLSFQAPVRGLRNLSIMLFPAAGPSQLGQLMSTYVVELDVAADGQFEILTPIPEITFNIEQLTVTASVVTDNGTDVSWDFGAVEGFQSTNLHTYNNPGSYEIILRLVNKGRLNEYKTKISVSRNHVLNGPLTAFPSFSLPPAGQKGILGKVNGAANDEVVVFWRVDRMPLEIAEEKLLDTPPGKHVVTFMAVRKLRARIHSQQRFVPEHVVELNGLNIRTNRVFEFDGNETTGTGMIDSANSLTEHIFPIDQALAQRLTLSAADRWTLELLLDDNPFLRSVTSNDSMKIELGDIADTVLMLEFETGIS